MKFQVENNVFVFYPTEEEFYGMPFQKFVELMEGNGAAQSGIAKVVPPPSFKPRGSGYGDVEVLTGNINIDLIDRVLYQS